MKNSDLEALKKELDAWRSSKDRGRLIPEELWERAVLLARELSVSKVHKAVRLDYRSLKARVNGSKKSIARKRKLKPSFVELSLPDSKQDCIFKVESASGARMQVEVPDYDIGRLSQMLREFAKN